MLIRILAIAVGGAIGSVARYLCSTGVLRAVGSGWFPWGTLSVNLIGSFAIGFLWAAFERAALGSTARSFVFIGILGGFTTFSSFTLENFNLLRDGQVRSAVINIIVSNLLGIMLVFAGFAAFKFLHR
jgi:CrcB protein